MNVVFYLHIFEQTCDLNNMSSVELLPEDGRQEQAFDLNIMNSI